MIIILNIPIFVLVAGRWYANEMALNCQVVNPPVGILPVNTVPTTLQLSPQPGLPFLYTLNVIHSYVPDSYASSFSNSENEQE